MVSMTEIYPCEYQKYWVIVEIAPLVIYKNIMAMDIKLELVGI